MLRQQLAAQRITVWLDEEDIQPGQDWDFEIRKAVRQSDVVVACLSPNAVTKSGFLQREIKFALDVADEKPEGTIFLVPARLEECDVPERLRKWQWVDLFDKRGLTKLLSALRSRAKELVIQEPLELPDDRSVASEVTQAFTELNPKYTFDTFVIGPGNQFAHAAARAVAERPSKAYNPLFLYGGVGMGKTHLMQAIGHEIKKRQPQMGICYLSAEEFTNEMINALRNNKMSSFRDTYRNMNVLLLDDIQFLAGKERTQEEFFHTINALHESMRQIVIASDRPPKELAEIEDRLRSRFASGLIADIQPPDLETKVAILQKKAESEHVSLPADVALYIASNIRSNVRELDGALIRLTAYVSLTGRDLNMPTAQEVLNNLVDPQMRKITIEAIQRAVSDQFGLRPAEIKAKNNSHSIVYPRQIAMYLAKQLTYASLPEIGRRFGGKHHTVVLHSVKKIEELRKTDKDLNRLLNKLTEVLGG